MYGNTKLLHHKVVYEDLRRMLSINNAVTFKKALLLNTTYPDMKSASCDTGSACVKIGLNPKFFKGSCCLCSKALLVCFSPPLCGMLEQKLAKSIGNIAQCQPPQRKHQSQDSVTKGCYSMDHTLGKLLTQTKSTRRQHHKSRGGNPCTAISRISWGYDTVTVKGRVTPVGQKGVPVINTAQKIQGAPYS